MLYPGSLHNHTDYSNAALGFRDSINTYESLINYAIELQYSAIAITEHEFIGNHIKIEKYANKVKDKIKVIRGNEIYLCRNELNKDNLMEKEKYYHFLLLAKDAIGHKQIRELSTRAWNRSFVDRGLRRKPTYYNDLEEIIGINPGHVIGSTACIGSAIGTQLLLYKQTQNLDNYKQIISWCLYLQQIFGKDYFYLELQPSGTKEQEYVNKELLKISCSLNIPYIITLDAHYLKKEDAPIHKAYLNSQSDAEREVDDFYSTTYLMSTDEIESYMNSYFDRSHFDCAYQNIEKIVNMCEDYSLQKPLKIPQLSWNTSNITTIEPKWTQLIPSLKYFIESDFEGDNLLAKLIVERMGTDETLQNKETYERVDVELNSTWISSLANKVHWSSYFLNLQKIIDTCWDAGTIVGPGRGSGVGFLILYILGITQINPLRETTKTFHWRFLNPERVSVLDVDFDISGLKRQQVLDKFREVYGQDRVANVITFGTEKSKSAILTAARGLNIDNDIAQYLASLVPSDRGMIRTLSQCYYGDKENDFKPITTFVNEMNNNYPELWQVAQRIEGLVCRSGIHAGGIVFVDEPFTESTALMRAPDGTIITQFELHDLEDASLIKYDALSVEGMDRIQTCLELLIEYGYVEKKKTLKETYESVIGIYNLDRTSEAMWKMVWDHKIQSLFQMEQQSGIQGIALVKPNSVDDLAILNSVIRLMAQEKGGEQPLNKFARFKNNISLWYKEMDSYGLSKEEQKILEPILKTSYGICESQEKFMQLVQIPECGGFDLNFADQLRKSIAKKNPAAYLELEKKYFQVVEEKGLSKKLCNYVWRVLIATSRGYGFNASHTLAYSLIGLQEMNLAFHYPIIFWNCANLIVDSGGNEEVNSSKNTNYEKIAKAINKMKEFGTNISLININSSSYTFKPDLKSNTILYGLNALSGVNSEVIKQIIEYRPYTSFIDFLERCPLNKTAMISLIKAGSFDSLEEEWANELHVEPRIVIMVYYILLICEPKVKLTLQNFNGLIQRNMIPASLEFQKKVFIFNKYLKAEKKVGKYYIFDDVCERFYSQFFDMEKLSVINGITCILQTDWDKIYQKEMDAARDWLKDNQEEVLKEFNYILFKECWDKYATGSISAWEMESLCFYYHDHELIDVDVNKYGISNFFNMPETPIVDYFFKRSGKEIPIYKTYKIIGTVISKNDTRSLVTILTTNGVVNVKFTKEYYAMFNRQISEIQPDGTKKIKEKGWFSRGSKIMVTGFRRDDAFVAKSYANTPTHQLYLITDVTKGKMQLKHDRYTSKNEEK